MQMGKDILEKYSGSSDLKGQVHNYSPSTWEHSYPKFAGIPTTSSLSVSTHIYVLRLGSVYSGILKITVKVVLITE